MEITVAAVQPNTLRGEREIENVSHALDAIQKAAEEGAQLVLFHEGYPGPYHGPAKYSPCLL